MTGCVIQQVTCTAVTPPMKAHHVQSHHSVFRAAALRSRPLYILQWILDITGFAVKTILCIDLQLWLTSWALNVLVHTCVPQHGQHPVV